MKDETLEEIALCYIIQRGSIELFNSSLFTDDRRYLYELLVLSIEEYKCINRIFCEILHAKEHNNIIQKLKQHYPIFNIAWSSIEGIFDKADNNIIKEDAARQLVPLLITLDKKREYLITISNLHAKVKRGDFNPLDDIIELSRFTGTTTYKAKDFFERFDDYSKEESSQIIRTGEAWLDNQASLLKGNIAVIAGDTGSMKTTTALWLIIKILIANPTYKAIFFEKEMPIADIMSKIISFFTATPTNEIILDKTKGIDAITPYINGEAPKAAIVRDILSRLKLVSTTEFHTIEDMLNFIETEKADVWVLDFLTQMFSEAENASAFNFKLMTGMNKIKLIVQRTGSTAIILAQLKKGTVEHRLLKIPQLDDMEWSGTLKHLANSVFFTFYPALYYGKTLSDDEKKYFFLCNEKNRFGTKFSIPLIAKPHLNRFEQPPQSNAHNNRQSAASEWLTSYIKNLSKY